MQPHTECVRRYSAESASRNVRYGRMGDRTVNRFRHPSERAPKKRRGEREQEHRDPQTDRALRRQAEGPGREGAEEERRREPVLGRTFLWTADSPQNLVVEQYREEQTRSEIYRVRHHVDDDAFIFTGAGYLLGNITA